ncbi:MAG: hypothetical protein U1E60_20885 [Reyranellaceae bacterium]
MTLLDKPIPMRPAGPSLGSLASHGRHATQLVAERLIAAHAKPRHRGYADIAADFRLEYAP